MGERHSNEQIRTEKIVLPAKIVAREHPKSSLSTDNGRYSIAHQRYSSGSYRIFWFQLASRRPPMPTSRMTMSTAASSKMRSAVKVLRSSKEERQVPCVVSVSSTWCRVVMYEARETGLLLMEMQSWMRPMRRVPSMLVRRADTLPLPFMPAMWMVGRVRLGSMIDTKNDRLSSVHHRSILGVD